jgi:predicted metal-dependent phosphoesterase TrpH
MIVADLHTHTVASDGDVTPEQLVAQATSLGLSALAVTDHDTTASVGAAIAASEQLTHSPIIVAGVEISCHWQGQEVHLLGLGIDPDHRGLTTALAKLAAGRRERFRAFIAAIPELASAQEMRLTRLVEESAVSLGRRHVAGLLVRTGIVTTRNEAFQRFLVPIARTLPPKLLLPVTDAIAMVHDAGGITSIAHPGEMLDDGVFSQLRDSGLDAVEVSHPSIPVTRSRQLRDMAGRLGLSVTGGSDWHGPDASGRALGQQGLTDAEWIDLRGRIEPSVRQVVV